MMFSREELWTDNNIPRSASLFSETCRPGDKPIMSLKGGRDDIPCLRDLYIALVVDDPSEGTFAETVFGDVYFWTRLRKAGFLQSYLEEWKTVTDIKRKQKAFKAIIDEVENQGRSSFTAAKYLVEQPWVDKRNTEAKKKNEDTSKAAANFYDEDVERLREQGFLQ